MNSNQMHFTFNIWNYSIPPEVHFSIHPSFSFRFTVSIPQSPSSMELELVGGVSPADIAAAAEKAEAATKVNTAGVFSTGGWRGFFQVHPRKLT